MNGAAQKHKKAVVTLCGFNETKQEAFCKAGKKKKGNVDTERLMLKSQVITTGKLGS